jgi:hypothetical protein
MLRNLPLSIHIIERPAKQLTQQTPLFFVKARENSAFQFQKLFHDKAFFLTPSIGKVHPYQAIIFQVAPAGNQAGLFHPLEHSRDSRALNRKLLGNFGLGHFVLNKQLGTYLFPFALITIRNGQIDTFLAL